MSRLILAMVTVIVLWSRALTVDVSGTWVVRLLTTDGKQAPVIDVGMTFSGSVRSTGREISGSWNTSANPEGGTFTATKR